tara:strand:+ start:108 stop:563 length:456 start_codon:yes stop_codon:yes gene_type:complete
MVKYYAYQDNEYDISKSIDSLSDLYSTENIISLPEKSYILRVPFIQKYNGVALVLSSSVILNHKIDLLDLDFQDALGITNTDNKIFIINCAHDYAKNNLSKVNMIMSPMRNIDVDKISWVINDNLDNMLTKQEKKHAAFLGQGKNENIISE